ncbi:hypothetical protein HYW11_02065 [Candidatus Peregrinibacteria bacterium]|nr:hypothetical protein [Candidatus Peregrinibacteria bacterium]
MRERLHQVPAETAGSGDSGVFGVIGRGVRAAYRWLTHDRIAELLTPEDRKDILAFYERDVSSGRGLRCPYGGDEYERRLGTINGILDMHYPALVADERIARHVRYRVYKDAGLLLLGGDDGE